MQEKFIEAFKEALEIEREISMTDSFRDMEEWNSLGRLSLIAMLDDVYEVTIEDEAFKKLITVSDLYAEVLKRSAEKK